MEQHICRDRMQHLVFTVSVAQKIMPLLLNYKCENLTACVLNFILGKYFCQIHTRIVRV